MKPRLHLFDYHRVRRLMRHGVRSISLGDEIILADQRRNVQDERLNT
jgi:hypothetical protein